MIASANGAIPEHALHAGFLSILPRIEEHARIYFRYLRCPDLKEDAVVETVALAWSWYRRLRQRGKDVAQFVSTLASYAARAVKSGRRLCGQEKAKDVLSPCAQRRYGFQVEGLPEDHSRLREPFLEALWDNTQTPVPDQVVFRVDFPDWRTSRSVRDQRLMDELLVGEQTQDVSRRFGLSAGRVSQLRREFHEDWLAFCDEA